MPFIKNRGKEHKNGREKNERGQYRRFIKDAGEENKNILEQTGKDNLGIKQ